MKDLLLTETIFVVIDVETTGLHPEAGDRICEIGAIKLKGKERISEFYTLVNPQHPISYDAFVVNQITQDMLKDAPTFNKIAPDFIKFIKEDCLLAYNIDFDLSFIKNELKILGFKLPENLIYIDLLLLSKLTLPKLGRYPLWNVAQSLGIKFNHTHRAMEDTYISEKVFLNLLNILEANGVTTLNKLYELVTPGSNLLQNKTIEKIETIKNAIKNKLLLKIDYLSTWRGEITRRNIEPLEIKEEGGSLYLRAYCDLRKQERTFAIENILRLKMIKQNK